MHLRVSCRRFVFGALGACLAASFSIVLPQTVAGASASTLVAESFSGTNVTTSPWVLPGTTQGKNYACLTNPGAPTTDTPIPGCDDSTAPTGIDGLELTTATTTRQGGVVYGLGVPTTEGLEATFRTYQFGGNGADGITFFLAATTPKDPSAPTIGGNGGSLGYAGNTQKGNGAAYGYLGFGLDQYGNFANHAYTGTGCPASSRGKTPDLLDVRGPGDDEVGYCLLSATGGPAQGELGTTGSAAAVAVPVEVLVNPFSSPITTATNGQTSPSLTVAADSWKVAVKPIGGTTSGATCLTGWWCASGTLPSSTSAQCAATTGTGGIPSGTIPCSWLGAAGIPDLLSFGWTGSTGGSTDYHVVNTVVVRTLSGAVPTYAVSTLSATPTGPYHRGQHVTFTATVALSAATEHHQVTITDSLSAGFTPTPSSDSVDLTGAPTALASCSSLVGTTNGTKQESCTFTPTAAGLSPGAHLEVRFGATVSGSNGEQLDDYVVVSSMDGVAATSSLQLSVAPGPVITSPVTGSSEPAPTVVVKGTAVPNTTVVLSVAGPEMSGTVPTTTNVRVSPTGTWQTSVVALEGTDTLVASPATTGGGTQPSTAVAIKVTSNTLVTNGGFETPQVTSSQTFASIRGWAPTSTCDIDLQRQATHGVTPYTGSQYAALGSTCAGGITQTVPTVPGQDYVLSFAYRAQPGTTAKQNTLSVAWRGSTLQWGTPSDPVATLQGSTTGPYSGWSVAYDLVQANATTTTLAFNDTDTTPSATAGDFLDAVSLAPFFPAKATNTTWQTADTETSAPGAPTRTIAFSNEHLWYKIPVEPDEQLTVHLSNVPANYDLLLFSDITAAYQTDTTPSTSSDVTELAAEDPTDRNAVEFSAAGGSIGAAGGSIGAAGGSIGAAGGSIGAAGGSIGAAGGSIGAAGGSIGAAGGSIGATGVEAGSAGIEAGAAGGSIGAAGGSIGAAGGSIGAADLALNQTFLAVSGQQGAVTKSVTADTFNNSGYYYAEVIGIDGSLSKTAFTISATSSGTGCQGMNLNTTVPTGAQGFPTSTGGTLSGRNLSTAYKTVIVTDSQTMATVTTGTLAKNLSRLAAATTGIIVNVGKSTAVQRLTTQAQTDHTCPYAVNLEADAIQNIVNSYRTGTGNLKYVVLVGGDTVIPFFRFADQEALEPESTFASVVSLATTTELEAALNDDYYLTDDTYGAAATIPIEGSTFPLQSAAVGRLVQGPAQIEKLLTHYLTTKTGSVIKVTSSLSAGYAFMAPPAAQIAKTFTAEGVTGSSNTQLITTDGVATSKVGTPPNTSWTAAKLSKKLTSKAHQLVFIGAHFNSRVMLAADHTSGKSTYLTTAAFASEIGTDLNGALVLSAGCHSGYSVNPAQSISKTTVAWPQTFAAAGATLIAGSGYQYSDANYVAYSDDIYELLAKELSYKQTTGSVHVGTALLHTEWSYLASLEALDGISEKSLLQVTLYGLPMIQVHLPDAPTTAPGASSSSVTNAAPVSGGPGKQLGLEEATLPVTAAITPTPVKPFTTVGTLNRDYYKATTGVTSEPDTPVVPVQTENVSVPNKTLRGVVLLHATYTDKTGVPQPLVGDPAVQTAPTPPTFTSDVYAPEKIWNPNYFGTLTNGTGTTLGVTPIQYVATPSTPKTATMRQYTRLTFGLFYSSTTGAFAEAPAPGVQGVSVAAQGTSVTVTATVPENELAGIQDVWVTYTNPNASSPSWTSLPLVQTSANPSVWKSTFHLTNPGAYDFMVQAVNAVGEATTDTNTGAYFTAGIAGTAPAAYSLSIPAAASGTYGTTVTVTAVLQKKTASGNAKHRLVSVSIGTAVGNAYTNTTGDATAQLTLVGMPPGTYPMSATFAGDGADSPAYATGSTFTIGAASTSLTITASSSTFQSGQPSGISAKLTSGGQPLSGEAVYFTVDSPSNQVVASSVATTTKQGIAQAGTLILPAGDAGAGYTVHAYFGTTPTPVSATAAVNASVVGYSAATTTRPSETVTDGTKTSVVASPSPGSYGHDVKLTATVAPTGTSSATWPVVTGAVNPSGSVVTFESGSTVLGTGNVSVSSSGVATATLTVTNLQGGTHTLTAVYPGSADLGASTGTTKETVAFTQPTITNKSGSLVVTSGETVLITGKLTGSVTVESGGGLEVDGGTVTGSISVTGAVGFTLCGATVGGSISVSNTPGTVLIGAKTGCAASKVGGSVSFSSDTGTIDIASSTISSSVSFSANTGTIDITSSTISGSVSFSGDKGAIDIATSKFSASVSFSGNTGGLRVTSTTIAGSVTLSGNSDSVSLATDTINGAVSVSGNKGGTLVSGNKITGSLSCSGNTPAPTDGGTANTASGGKSGQCAKL